MKTAKEYKGIAKSNLKGSYWNAFLVSLIVTGLTTAIAAIPVIGTIASVLATPFLLIGMFAWFIGLSAGEVKPFGILFEAGKTNYVKALCTYLLQALYLALWSLLFVIPGLVKSYSYTMAMYLRTKKPELGANEAITLSREIMNGRKWKLFCLHFSFIGWFILCILTFGLGFIFLKPYIDATNVTFYEDAYKAYFGAEAPAQPESASVETTEV